MLNPKKMTSIVLFIMTVVVHCGCAPPPVMVQKQRMTEKDKDMDHAVVTFVRSSVMSPTQKADIWDRDTPVGELSARGFIQYKASPGPHLFMARGEMSDKWSYVEAVLITGEHYVIKVNAVPGGATARIEMMPTSPTDGKTSKDDIEDWLTGLKGRALVEDMEKTYVDQRGKAAEKAIKAYEEGKMIPEIMKPEDFWPDSL
jgi:hypothetical protein